MSKIWKNCLKTLKEILPIQTYTRWIMPITAVEKGEALTLTVQDPQALLWINTNIKITIISLAHQINNTVKVNIITSKKRTNPLNSLINRLGYPLINKYTFDNLILGDANKFAYYASEKIAKNITDYEYSPFVIYGNSGTGKTHLLQATGHLAKQKNPDLNIIYTPLINFVQNITSGIRHKQIETIKKCYQAADLLLIDDIHLIADKTKSQEEFFHILNFLSLNKKQIILTCDQVPKNIKRIENRIVSRLNQGLILQIKPPELEMRAAILIDKAEKVGINLSEDIALFIASKIIDNVRELEGAIKQIKASIGFYNLQDSQLEINQIKDILKNLIPSNNKLVDITDIQKIICRYYGINITGLTSHRRTKDLVYPRQMAIFLSIELTGLNLSQIGQAFKRDHTTIIHTNKKIIADLINNKTTQDDYKNLKIKINGL